MDQKYFNGAFIVVPLMTASMIASSLSGRVLEWLGVVEPSTLAFIVAGTVIGTVIGIAIWLIMVLIWGTIRPGGK